MQGAFEGTEAQTSAPVNLSLVILGAEEVANEPNHYSPSIFKGFTSSNFYHYQINGAVDKAQKSCGYVPFPNNHQQKADVLAALAALLPTLQTWGGFVRDATGLGITKLVLLWLAIHAKFNNTEAPLPSLLLVPATLVKQWAKEIREHWPGFDLWVMYADSELDAVHQANIITKTHLRKLPNTSDFTPPMKQLFDKGDKSSLKQTSIILSSYETFSDRSVFREELKTKDEKGKEVKWNVWRTRLHKYIGAVILDEGHRAKNPETRTHASIYLLDALHTWIVTATPMQNTERVSSVLKITF